MASTAISAQGTIVQIATGTGGAKTITAVTVGYPAIVTSTAHGL
ncbi:MAG: phage tail protein, partial [Betaproteobacteria bacterium]|nr:phage tail protein [Betaproteobacteria bacterium]